MKSEMHALVILSFLCIGVKRGPLHLGITQTESFLMFC